MNTSSLRSLQSMDWLAPSHDALIPLCAAIAGRPHADVDWMQVIAAANTHLLTSELAEAVLAGAQHVPADVGEYLSEIAKRNRHRNGRLRILLVEAVTALNASGIEPMVLKGGAMCWVADTCAEGRTRNRMMVDIDLLVRPEERETALAALAGARFAPWRRRDGEDVHVFAELARDGDVASIDLHQRPAGPPGLAEQVWDDAASAPASINGARLRLPTQEMYVFLATLHDHFHDSGYWTGKLNLRHLVDIAQLTRQTHSFDWDRLFGLCRTGLTRAALNAQLIASARLFDANIPVEVDASVTAQRTFRRMRTQLSRPRLRPLLGAMAFIANLGAMWRHIRSNSRDRKELFGPTFYSEDWSARLDRMARTLR